MVTDVCASHETLMKLMEAHIKAIGKKLDDNNEVFRVFGAKLDRAIHDMSKTTESVAVLNERVRTLDNEILCVKIEVKSKEQEINFLKKTVWTGFGILLALKFGFDYLLN